MTELRMGQAQTIAALNRQTEVLEKIGDQLADHVARSQPAAPVAPAPTTSSDRLSIRDWVQIAIGVGVVLGALTGRLTWSEAVSIGGKPFGF